MLEALARKKLSFRKASLSCLEKLLKGLEAHDLLPLVAPVLLEAAATAPLSTVTQKDLRKVEETPDEPESQPLPLTDTLQCVAAAWRAAGATTAEAQAAPTSTSLAAALQPDRPWAARAAAMAAVGAMAKRMAEVASSPLPPPLAAHLQTLLPLVLVGLEDLKLSQVRSNDGSQARAVVRATCTHAQGHAKVTHTANELAVSLRVQTQGECRADMHKGTKRE